MNVSHITKIKYIKVIILTLSCCIPPALDAFITKINNNASGRYSLSLCVTSPDPPMPGVSTRIVFACFE